MHQTKRSFWLRDLWFRVCFLLEPWFLSPQWWSNACAYVGYRDSIVFFFEFRLFSIVSTWLSELAWPVLRSLSHAPLSLRSRPFLFSSSGWTSLPYGSQVFAPLPLVSRFHPSHNKARVCIEIGLIKETLPNRVLIGSTVYVWITSKKSLI